ncbi:MAG TPA: OmpA family protein, partial [Treponemataceae bacterium]|nr:OmpA family protein [Treponemataceae bacterium]
MVKRFFLFLCLIVFPFLSLSAQVLTATSSINWNTREFVSDINLDLQAAGFKMPSGRNAAENKIKQQLPALIKSPLLGIPVDNATLLGDTILLNYMSLEDLTQIVDDSSDRPGIYSGKTDSISLANTIELTTIAALMIKHQTPYQLSIPIEKVSSREFTGIIIDMREKLPVHGEFVSDYAVPCFFPKIYDEQMNLIYERNMTDPVIAKKSGIVQYTDSLNEKNYENRIGQRPLRITARKVFGVNRTDPIITRNDALKILSKHENLQLLKDGRIVFLLHKDSLVYKATAPLKDIPYYFAYERIQEDFTKQKLHDVSVSDSPKGILI